MLFTIEAIRWQFTLQPAEAFGLVLRQLRRARGLSQEKLAFEAGLERNFISLLELGQRSPSLVTIFKLAQALHIKPSALVGVSFPASPDKVSAPALPYTRSLPAPAENLLAVLSPT